MTFEISDSWRHYSASELLDEYAYYKGNVGAKILQTVIQLCRQTATPSRRPPRIYNQGRPWSQSEHEDLAQEVIERQLYKAGSKVWVFETDVEQQAGSIEARLVTVIERELSHRRREDQPIETRLVDRCVLHAEEYGLSLAQFANGTVISIIDESLPEPQFGAWEADKVRQVACTPGIASIPKLFSQSVERQSMGYNLPELMQVLRLIVDREKQVTTRNLQLVFKDLFTFLTLPTHVDGEDLSNLSKDSEPHGLNSESQQKIEELAHEITDRQARNLLYKLNGYSDSDIEAAGGGSRPTITKDRNAVIEKLQHIADEQGLDDTQGEALFREFIDTLETRVAEEDAQ